MMSSTGPTKKHRFTAGDRVVIESIKSEWTSADIERKYALAVTTLPRNWETVKARILGGTTKRCAVCGGGGKISVHHRDGDERNNRRANLVPLCLECHDKLPVPPFSEAFYCQTIILDESPRCLKLHKLGLGADNCAFFSGVHGCMLDVLDIAREELAI